MSKEAQELYDIVGQIIERRRDRPRVSPSWIATEAMATLDAKRISIPLVYLGCHLQLRQIARQLCRGKFEDDDDESSQHELFPDLQWRYPAARSDSAEEPEYVLLEEMTDEDVESNTRRLRLEARAKLKHADALEAWARLRKKGAEAAE